VKTLAVSKRAALAKPSPTLAISAKAKAMKAEGIDVISFGAGEPDFNTPEPICRAAKEAIDQGFTKYTQTSGMPELRAAIAGKLTRENQIAVSPDQIVVSSGAKQSLYNAAMMLLDIGDEAIVIAPYWMTYIDQIELAGAKPMTARALAENDFIPDVNEIEQKITNRTRAIFINTPCNPTGAVYPRATLESISSLAERHDLWIICDEIYERLVYGAAHVSIASLSPAVSERTITIGGCSKTFAMTGWRIGYAAAPLPIARTMSAFQDAVTSNANSIAQHGALEAFKMGGEEVERMREEFETRRNLMRTELLRIEGLQVSNPKGAFYFLIAVRAFLGGKYKSDDQLAQALLEHGHVATVPGSVFDAAGYIRLSYTASQKNIKTGVERIGDFLQTLQN